MKSLLLLLTAITLFACSGVNSGTIPPEDTRQKLAHGALIIDVRTMQEYQAGHIPGAINIPYDKINAAIEQMNLDKDREIITYCQSGRRANIAKSVLENAGFEHVFNGGRYGALIP